MIHEPTSFLHIPHFWAQVLALLYFRFLMWGALTSGGRERPQIEMLAVGYPLAPWEISNLDRHMLSYCVSLETTPTQVSCLPVPRCSAACGVLDRSALRVVAIGAAGCAGAVHDGSSATHLMGSCAGARCASRARKVLFLTGCLVVQQRACIVRGKEMGVDQRKKYVRWLSNQNAVSF